MIEQAETQIRLNMPMIYGDDTGNSPILSYNLQFNLGGNSEQYISVVGEAPDSLVQEVLKGGLTTDVVYKFRYRVRNKYGWSEDYSPIMQARTATIPDPVDDTLGFQVIDELTVRISWDQPYNGGSPVLKYTIVFLAKDGENLHEIKAYCDGSQTRIIIQRYCDIPMTEFRQAPL